MNNGCVLSVKVQVHIHGGDVGEPSRLSAGV